MSGYYLIEGVTVYDLHSATPLSPSVTLLDPSAGQPDNFGKAKAISNNLSVIGASGDDTGATDAGAAYIYDLASASPGVANLRLQEPTPLAGRNFGYVVAISGNYVTISTTRDSDSTILPTVYVYDLQSSTPTIPIATLPQPSAQATGFGSSLAISGNQLAVGANQDNEGPNPFAGAVYLYDLSGATPTTPIRRISNPRVNQYGYFGYSIALADNLLVVGVQTANYLASAQSPITEGADLPETLPPPPPPGAAYIYDLSNANLAPLLINDPHAQQGGLFGYAVAISGSIVLVSSPLDNVSASSSGSVSVYDLTASSPSQPKVILSKPTPAFWDEFGASIAISTEYVVVGAPLDDTQNLDDGAVYIFGHHLGPPAPEVEIYDPNGIALSSGAGAVYFGTAAPDQTITAPFTIRNVGNADLTNLSINIDGPDAQMFGVTTQPGVIVAPNEQTLFTITFSSLSAGYRSATAHLLSNATELNPFDITVFARALSEQEAWRQTYFGNPDNIGNGADSADPDGDGYTNEFEFVAALDPTDPNSRFKIQVEDVLNEPGQKAIIFSRVVPGRSYEVRAANDLSDPVGTPLTNFTFSDNGNERTVIDLAAAGTAKFYNVRVTKP